jgi:hypothetical protein
VRLATRIGTLCVVAAAGVLLGGTRPTPMVTEDYSASVSSLGRPRLLSRRAGRCRQLLHRQPERQLQPVRVCDGDNSGPEQQRSDRL